MRTSSKIHNQLYALGWISCDTSIRHLTLGIQEYTTHNFQAYVRVVSFFMKLTQICKKKTPSWNNRFKFFTRIVKFLFGLVLPQCFLILFWGCIVLHAKVRSLHVAFFTVRLDICMFSIKENCKKNYWLSSCMYNLTHIQFLTHTKFWINTYAR